MPLQIKTVRTDAFSMDYFHFGSGKETLVILPGLSVASVMKYAGAVVQAYKPLTSDFTIYVFDRRRELPPSYSVYEMARDTEKAFRELNLPPVNIFGASQGGMIAQVIAIEHPERVKKLVLGSTAPCVKESQYQIIREWIRLAEERRKTDLYMAFGKALYPQELFEQSRELLIEAAQDATDEDLKRFIILAQGARDFDVVNDLVRIACPVLVIGSTDDQVLGADASYEISEHLDRQSGSELYMYDGFGHAAYDTAPDYKERILRFLKRS